MNLYLRLLLLFLSFCFLTNCRRKQNVQEEKFLFQTTEMKESDSVFMGYLEMEYNEFETISFNEEVLNNEEVNAKALGVDFQIVQMKKDSSTSGHMIWKGNLGDVDSFVIFSKTGKSITGYIETHNPKKTYELVEHKGRYFIYETSQAKKKKRCKDPTGTNQESFAKPKKLESFTDSGNIIDVLIYYSVDAKNGAGGGGKMSDQLTIAIENSNRILQNSGLGFKLKSVGFHEIEFNESGDIDKDVRWAHSNSKIRSMRDASKADIVIFIVEKSSPDYAGTVIEINESLDPRFESLAYALVQRSWVNREFTFFHEAAHLMGARHNCESDNDITPYPYSHGYSYCSSNSSWRTLMANETQCGGSQPVIAYLSNPALKYNGIPLGISAPPNCLSNNTMTLGNTARLTANFRVNNN